ncbi:HNH endonuclease signature motif containing protein [Pengzhenrongella frigida]|uniref:HNH endonuclease n=1 Tax=Pengzhenrongella frigida TaxID=1259133 RepID=A0A4Q5N415_9MICO|nr:HNH endonuclease signature motif containing protein [Cellulomonas sp. HLT2-17]RYV52916.1 HNH endonuclease [Cellulomonas sp. HLT2-17]
MFESAGSGQGAGEVTAGVVTPAPRPGPDAPEPAASSVEPLGATPVTVAASVDLVFAAMIAELLVRPSATTHTPPATPRTPGTLSGARRRRPPASGAPDWAPGGIAGILDAHTPGIDLTTLLDDLDPAHVSDTALIEIIAAWERTSSWAAARQGDAIAELAARRTTSRTLEFTGDEIAARLAMTRTVAEAKVTLAQALTAAPEVHTALTTGTIDTRKAIILTEDTAHLPRDHARALQSAVLPDAGDLTPPALRNRLRRTELTTNPAATTDRHTRAAAGRRVTLTPANDAMAWLTAYLPAPDATTIYDALTALATTTAPRPTSTSSTGGTGSGGADAPGAPGDDRGIDARRADALTDVLRTVLDTGLTLTGTHLATTHRRRPHLNVTVAATTLLGLDNTPAELAGYGPIPAHLARQIATDATWRRILTDPTTGDTLAVGTCTYRPGADLTRTIATRDTTCTFPGCRTPAYRCDLDHLTPYDHTLHPGSDHLTGHPSHPPQTRCENLHTLCRHHHRLKTHTNWDVYRDPTTGTTHWTAPTQHRYARPPTPAASPTRAATSGAPGAPGGSPPGSEPPASEPPASGPPRHDLGPPPPF